MSFLWANKESKIQNRGQRANDSTGENVDRDLLTILVLCDGNKFELMGESLSQGNLLNIYLSVLSCSLLINIAIPGQISHASLFFPHCRDHEVAGPFFRRQHHSNKNKLWHERNVLWYCSTPNHVQLIENKQLRTDKRTSSSIVQAQRYVLLFWFL